MPKHRSNVFTVVRERQYGVTVDEDKVYELSAIIGTYATLMRAEEVAGAAQQVFKEGGGEDEYKFSVRINTWYDE